MKFQFVSDLHIDILDCDDFANIIVPDDDADVLLIAGDIGYDSADLFDKFIRYCSENFKQTLFVLGNHEFYKCTTMELRKNHIMEAIAPYTNVFMLDNNFVVLGNILILGAALWSLPSDEMEHLMNDYKYIYKEPNLKLSAAWVQKIYHDNVDWIRHTIRARKTINPNIRVVMLSHHVPSYDLLYEINELASSLIMAS